MSITWYFSVQEMQKFTPLDLLAKIRHVISWDLAVLSIINIFWSVIHIGYIAKTILHGIKISLKFQLHNQCESLDITKLQPSVWNKWFFHCCGNKKGKKIVSNWNSHLKQAFPRKNFNIFKNFRPKTWTFNKTLVLYHCYNVFH